MSGCSVGVVEAQPVGRDERAGLLHGRAEDVLQRLVQQVRGGVVRGRVEAPAPAPSP